MARRNELRDGVADLADKAFTPAHVHQDPLIFTGFDLKRPKSNPDRSKTTSATPMLDATEQKGDLLIRDLWQNRTNSVHDMRVVNTDAK